MIRVETGGNSNKMRIMHNRKSLNANDDALCEWECVYTYGILSPDPLQS